MGHRKILLVFWMMVLVLAPLGVQAQESTPQFPENQAAPGWEKMGAEREFNKNGLYGHIDGGSELFLEMGFEILHVQKYVNPQKDEMAVEIYRMDSAEAALGIYLINCGEETPLTEIPDRHSADDYQITILKGQYFLKVNNFSGKPALKPAMIQLANLTLKNIPPKQPEDLLALLPVPNRIKGTELLIRGQYSLQSIFTLGEGDVLQLHNTIFGVSAQYRDEQENIYTRILVRYPETNLANQAFHYLKQNLDSYIKVIESNDSFLRFKDFKEKTGLVELSGKTIQITVNLIK